HVRFNSIDGMNCSINLEKASSKYGECIFAYEMNGMDIPRDHGFPRRAIAPGYVGVRNVKWLNRVELSSEEADSAFQRGLNYKILPPSVREAKSVDFTKIPAMLEASVFSGITKLETQGNAKLKDDDGTKQITVVAM
ncbi:MAG: molybdopterin-dependent oxidoreductase, partial [bacterium]